ncbi:PKD-like family lipoprotein [Pedobacter sp. UBA5917]|uniref:PKD-like family lipoprotein n=1 Tax=Pedobacter sp. UBA5917 TaxID=1947061 RepID=UPI0025F75C4C|nr:PKD-like family lipoprotein [Pedobacter sp. UBA5917]
MKKLYVLLMGLMVLITSSCVKESENAYIPDLPAATVSGYEKAYTVFTHQDQLDITPAVSDERSYNYYWTVFSNNYTVGSGIIPKGDTISRSKDLHYEVLLNPGAYTLVLNLKNRITGVTQMITSALSVSTLTMTGWYILKDDGNKTDFDFIYPTGRIDNWMANFNDGKGLTGKSIKAVFSGSFKNSLKSTDLYSVMIAITDQDAAIFRLDNGKRVMGFDDMFFTRPDVKKPQNILQPMADNNVFLINDNKLFTLTKGTLFASPPLSTYKISPVAAIAARGIFFDDNSKSMVFSDNGTFALPGANGALVKNMNADMIWAGGYAGLRSAALTLFRKPTGEGLLIRMNASYGPLAGSGDMILGTKVVPATHGLMSADAIGGNYDSDYIYYAKGNNIYMTDFTSISENLQVTLPQGEVVTCIQHIKYPQPAAGVTTTVDFLAIASYQSGKYKVWLHKISSIGTIQQLSKPDFEGQGKVSCLNYVEKGNGSRVF